MPKPLLNVSNVALGIQSLQQQVAALSGASGPPLPATWDEWVSTIQIKSGSGIKNMVPMEWQSACAHQILVKDKGKRKSYNWAKSRQGGGTTFLYSIIGWICLNRPNTNALFLHKSFEDAGMLGQRNRKFLKSAGVKLPGDAIRKQELTNGSMMLFRSSDPESCGRGLDSIDILVLEECQYYDDLDKTLGAISAAQAWCDEGLTFFITTPNGTTGEAERYWKNIKHGRSDDEMFDIFDAIEAGEDEPFQIWGEDEDNTTFVVHWRCVPQHAKRPNFKAWAMATFNLSEEDYKREFGLNFRTSGKRPAYVPEAVRGQTSGEWEDAYEDEVYYAALDTSGGGTDYTVLLILKKVNNKFYVVYMYRRQRRRVDQHLEKIKEILEIYRPISLGVEQNSYGLVYAEQLTGAFDWLEVQTITTSAANKPKLCENLGLAIDRGDLFYPLSAITEELLDFTTYKRGKYVLFEAATGHDDTVMALCFGLKTADYGGVKTLKPVDEQAEIVTYA